MSQKMQPQDAEAVLMQDVYVPAFIEKCAAEGIDINDAADLQAALETVAVLKQAATSQSSNVIKSAHAAVLNATGKAETQASVEQEKRASDLLKNKQIKDALAVLAQK